MSHSVEELWQLLRQAQEMPYGTGQIALVEQVVRHADALGAEELCFAARMVGTSAYTYGGEPAKAFVTFSWCLADYDRAPKPHHVQHGYTLLWHFKWMVNGLTKFPEVPLDRTYAVLDDMERRYRDGGHSPQAVYKQRHLVARHVGDAEAAAQWYRRWITAPRDELSDCAGCDPSAQVRHLAALGRDEEAVALAEPVLAGRLSCLEQPQSILTVLLGPYLRTGRRELARDAHRRAYRRLRGNVADLANIGKHLEFCALTGNEARGLEILERHLGWLDRSPSPAATMDFAAGAAVVLRRLTEAGRGELTVHRPAHGERPAADVPVGELATELAAVATGLAARFDERNGSTAQSESVASRLAIEPVGEHLPLSPTARRRPGPVAVGNVAAVAGASGAPAPVDAPADPLAEVPADATPERLLELADEFRRAEREAALVAVARVFAERFAGHRLDPATAARWAELRGNERAHVDDLCGAAAAWEEARELFERLPDPVRAQVAAGRLGAARCALGEPEEGLRLIEESLAFLAGHGDAELLAGAHLRHGAALARLERWPEALAAHDRAARVLSGADDPQLRARLELGRARCLQMLDRPEDARVAAADARDRYRRLGLPERHAVACLLYAETLADAAEAVDAFGAALPGAEDEVATRARWGRAGALLAVGRPEEAIDDLVEVLGFWVERGVEGAAAYARFRLADAYRHAGRPLEAAELGEEAVVALDRLGAQADADNCRHLLSSVYMTLGENESALAVLDQLATNLDGPDNLPARGRVLEEAAELLYRMDRDALAAQRFDAAATAYGLAGLRLDELRARRREVVALHWAGEPERALAALERADALGAALPAAEEAGPEVVWERCILAEHGAQALIGADRPDAALARLDGVAGRLRSIEAFGEALQVDVLHGETLLRLDRPAEAEPVLRAALAALPSDAGVVPRTAWLLSRALTALGRAAEAEEICARYDLDPES